MSIQRTLRRLAVRGLYLGFRRRLLPGRTASGLFWRAAGDGEAIADLEPVHRTRIGEVALELKLPLAFHQNWTMLFDRIAASPDAFALHVFAHYVREASCIFDVGSNVGLYFLHAIGFRRDGGAVYAFEPQPRLAALLCDHVTRNALSNAFIVEASVSARAGRSQLHIPGSSRMASLDPHFLARRRIDLVEHLETDLLSLDDFCRDRSLAPDLLKIDVEGHEAAVLEGAHATLRRLPTLLIEISAENARSGQVARLFSLGYTAYVIGDRKLLPLPSHEELVEITVGTEQVDCLFTNEPSTSLVEYFDGHTSDQRSVEVLRR